MRLFSQKMKTIKILLYTNGDLLVSGHVVLTSVTSVPTFTFIHFSHFALDFRSFRTVVLCLRRAYRASVLNEKDFSEKYTPCDQILTTNSTAHSVLFSLDHFFLYLSGLPPSGNAPKK